MRNGALTVPCVCSLRSCVVEGGNVHTRLRLHGFFFFSHSLILS